VNPIYQVLPNRHSITNSDDSAWHIALKKGAHFFRNTHPIYNILSYHKLSPS